MHQSSKRGKWRGLLRYFDSTASALGGLEIRSLILRNERAGQTKALTINIGRRWDDRYMVFKAC